MRKRLGLINYEGDCLKAIRYKGDNEIYIEDQFGSLRTTLTKRELFQFFDGRFDIEDSKGTNWNYPKESKEAKPSYEKIYEFIED